MNRLRSWVSRLAARFRDRRTVRPLMQCLHPNPPGFSACNRYGYATCLTCKAKIRC